MEARLVGAGCHCRLHYCCDGDSSVNRLPTRSVGNTDREPDRTCVRKRNRKSGPEKIPFPKPRRFRRIGRRAMSRPQTAHLRDGNGRTTSWRPTGKTARTQQLPSRARRLTSTAAAQLRRKARHDYQRGNLCTERHAVRRAGVISHFN